MISRSSLGRATQLKLRGQCCIKQVNRRGLAAPASGSFQYETSDAAGVKVASRDLTGPTTTLALVAKAGTRYQTHPGFTELLEQFAFKSTYKRSALRITREVELLGGNMSAGHSRENLVLQAKFLRDDLPYFVELFSEVAGETKYTMHELQEEVIPILTLLRQRLLDSPDDLAINSAHGIAFHRGLGTPLHSTSSTPLTTYLDGDAFHKFVSSAYAKPNIAVVANGANQGDLSKWVNEFFKDYALASDSARLESTASKYYGGEERIAHSSRSSMVIAFPGSSSFTSGSSYKPEVSVLAALLGGQSSIKWAPGFSLLGKVAAANPGVSVSTTNAAYSDAGLLYVSLSGPAGAVRGASAEVVKILKTIAGGEISKENITKAVALAKFTALEAGQEIAAGLESTGAGLIQGGRAFQIDEVGKAIDAVKAEQVAKLAKTLLEGKATVASVGDLFVLPFGEEIGLNV